jgi:ferredoxin
VSLRLRVNPIACEAHGLCAELLPELIRIEVAEVPRELLALAERAVDACPTLALLLEEESQAPQGRPGGSPPLTG